MAKPNTPRQDPTYVVCRVQRKDGGGGITLEPVQTVKAPRHKIAVDMVVDGLPPEDRNATFGAFTEGHWKQFDYSARQEWQTSAKESSSPWAGAPSAEASEPQAELETAGAATGPPGDEG